MLVSSRFLLIGGWRGLDLLFNPVFFSGVLAYFKQAIVLTQIISMVIITGLLLTNKKHDF
jgi:hypothetical protein